jgi:hypothetical protein
VGLVTWAHVSAIYETILGRKSSGPAHHVPFTLQILSFLHW